MFSCSVMRNDNVLKITGTEDKWQLMSVGGLNPPNANINTSKSAFVDGSKFNSAVLNNRNIVIKLKLNGDVENNRLELYNYFGPKGITRCYFSNGARSVYIDGYVESVEVDPFSMSEILQISMVCPDPYFIDVNMNRKIAQDLTALFTFPFAIDADGIPFSEILLDGTLFINNPSEYACPLKMTLNILDAVESIELRHLTSGKYIKINYEFLANDTVYIMSATGNKSIRLVRSGESINLFSALDYDSDFFQLESGQNEYKKTVDEGTTADNAKVEMYFDYNITYGGI